ncbi:MAG: S8 family peptidase [Fidelibacterota bacterium]
MAGPLNRLWLVPLLVAAAWAQIPPSTPRRNPVIHPRVTSPAVRHDSPVHAWIYFRDKGIDSSGYAGELQKARTHISARARARRARVISGEVVSSRDFPLYEPYVSRIRATGAVLRHRSRWLNALSVAATLSQLERISQFPFVARIDPVLVYRRPRQEVPSLDNSVPSSRLRRGGGGGLLHETTAMMDTLDYGLSRDQIRQINCHLAHEAGYNGDGVRVLMLDTGFFKDHESIQNRPGGIVAEWDFVNNDGNTQDEPGDSVSQDDHGTFTLSALGGYMPGKLIGPAYGAELLLAKTEIVTEEIRVEEDNFVAALEWGERLGADVASSSVGYLDWYTYRDMDGNTAVTTRAVDRAVSLGMVCVTAAGNEGNGQWYYVMAPADADSVISVGAVDAQGEIAVFSSRGPTYDGRVKPEVCARGVATASAGTASPSSYTFLSGTSMAAPLVAGAVAVILSAHPDWTPVMIREALLKTASRSRTPDNTYGWGIIDTWAAINTTQFTGPPDPHLPERFYLAQNYPNPFNRFTFIPFEIPAPGPVTVTVINLLGHPVATLVDEVKNVGRYTVEWDGSQAASGVYIVRMTSGDFAGSRKMILIK